MKKLEREKFVYLVRAPFSVLKIVCNQIKLKDTVFGLIYLHTVNTGYTRFVSTFWGAYFGQAYIRRAFCDSV